MDNTNSLAFPNMFNAAQNQVAVLSGDASIVNRTRLLLLTQPTELYNSPDQGVGLKKYLFQYNNLNTQAMMKAEIISKLTEYEPYVIADETQFVDKLISESDTDDSIRTDKLNEYKVTVGLVTRNKDSISIDIND